MNEEVIKEEIEDDPKGVLRYYSRFKKPVQPAVAPSKVPFSPSVVFVDLTLNDEEPEKENMSASPEQLARTGTSSRRVVHRTPLRLSKRSDVRIRTDIFSQNFSSLEGDDNGSGGVRVNGGDILDDCISEVDNQLVAESDMASMAGRDDLDFEDAPGYDDAGSDIFGVHIAGGERDELDYEELDNHRGEEWRCMRVIHNEPFEERVAEHTRLEGSDDNYLYKNDDFFEDEVSSVGLEETGDEMVEEEAMDELVGSEVDEDFLEDELEDDNLGDEMMTMSKVFEGEGIRVGDGDKPDDDDVESVISFDETEPQPWFFCNHKNDVLAVLSYYDSKNDKKKKLGGQKENLNYASNPNILSNSQRNMMVIYNNQLYRPKEESSSGLVIARCTHREEHSRNCCPGSIHIDRTSGGIGLHVECVHPHRRDFISMELIFRKLRIMEKSGSEKMKLYGIAVRLSEKYEVKSKLKSNEHLSRKLSDFCKDGRCGNEFPPCFGWTAFQHVECLTDTSYAFSESSPVILVWRIRGSEKFFNAGTKTIHVDGKYSKIPSQFRQLYCISTYIDGVTVPLLFALTSSSTTETYRTIFEVAKEKGLNPVRAYSDFERAAITALSVTWPRINVYLCFRHLKVSLRKNLRKTFGARVAESNTFRLFLKTLYTLAFCPLDKLEEYYNILRRRTLHFHARIDEFYMYLENTYVRDNAVFPPVLWNCRSRCILGLDHTNNPSERLFSNFSRLFSHSNYTQLHLSVRRSSEWCQTIYKDEASGRSRKNRVKRDPLYKKPEFRAAVTTMHNDFDEFAAKVAPYMTIPKLSH